MKNWKKWLCVAFLFGYALVLCGCAMTVEQMYCLPRRSERYENLQTVMEQAMDSLEYSAPVAGENQQIVQMADLDGDSNSEVILFAKGGETHPLKILLFTPVEEGYKYLTTIESNGTGFDQVEYVQMDGKPGLEMIVGCKVSDQVLRNVSVYGFSGGEPEQMMNANYVQFLTCDLDGDALSDLFLIHPGAEESEQAVAELYSMSGGNVKCSEQAELSVSSDKLRRIVTGKLETGEPSVYVAGLAGEKAVITDVFALVRGTFTNVSFSNESGTSVQTLRDQYIYADDIDMDGVVELPDLISVQTPGSEENTSSQFLIRWYAMTISGSEVDKMYTYHNFLDGWYVELDQELALRTVVLRDTAGGYQFNVLSEDGQSNELLFTIYTLTGEDRLTVPQQDDLQEILKTDNVVYAAKMEPLAAEYGMTVDRLSECFRLIQVDWKTGEM